MKTRRSGGIGRRARLKIVFLRECGFDSHLRHWLALYHAPPAAAGERRLPLRRLLFVRETAASRSRALLWRYVLKLSLIFLVIDLLILLAYPILYIIDRVRKIFRIQR